jgi:hypothetical protein
MTSCGARPSGAPDAEMRCEHYEWMRIYCHGMQIILLDSQRQWLVMSGQKTTRLPLGR